MACAIKRTFETLGLMALAPCLCSVGIDQVVRPRQPAAGTFAPCMLCRVLRRGGQRRNNAAAFIMSSGFPGRNLASRTGDDVSLGLKGMCEALSRDQAESLLAGEAEGWELKEDEKQLLSIARTYKTKNFVKALELCQRFGEVAEQEGHHPDLHVQGWNKLTVELTTHSREGLTEKDFTMAAKLNAVPKDDLLSKKKAAAAAVPKE